MASTILLVDDSPTVRTIVKVYLTGLDFAFLEASNGQEALDVLARSAVNLVIADINMPGMDGLTFLERIRASDRAPLRKLPVILLTGESTEESRLRGLKSGAAAWVKKPVTNQELRAAITSALKPAA